MMPGTENVDPKPLSGRERRRKPRFAVRVPVREVEPEWHLWCATSVSDIGLFVPDALPREEGSNIVLEIELAGNAQPIVVRAKVVRSGTGPSGFGVAFEFGEERPEDLSGSCVESVRLADVLRRRAASWLRCGEEVFDALFGAFAAYGYTLGLHGPGCQWRHT